MDTKCEGYSKSNPRLAVNGSKIHVHKCVIEIQNISTLPNYFSTYLVAHPGQALVIAWHAFLYPLLEIYAASELNQPLMPQLNSTLVRKCDWAPNHSLKRAKIWKLRGVRPGMNGGVQTRPNETAPRGRVAVCGRMLSCAAGECSWRSAGESSLEAVSFRPVWKLREECGWWPNHTSTPTRSLFVASMAGTAHWRQKFRGRDTKARSWVLWKSFVYYIFLVRASYFRWQANGGYFWNSPRNWHSVSRYQRLKVCVVSAGCVPWSVFVYFRRV